MKKSVKRVVRAIDARVDPGNARGKALIQVAAKLFHPDPFDDAVPDANSNRDLAQYLESRGYNLDPATCTYTEWRSLFALFASVLRCGFTESIYDQPTMWLILSLGVHQEVCRAGLLADDVDEARYDISCEEEL